MTTHSCFVCTTPLQQIIPRLMQTLCTCGHELQWHCLAKPHPMPSVGCPGFTVVPVATPQPDTDAQPALF